MAVVNGDYLPAASIKRQHGFNLHLGVHPVADGRGSGNVVYRNDLLRDGGVTLPVSADQTANFFFWPGLDVIQDKFLMRV